MVSGLPFPILMRLETQCGRPCCPAREDVLAQGFDIDGTDGNDNGETNQPPKLVGTSVTDRIRGFGGDDVALIDAGTGVDVSRRRARLSGNRCAARLRRHRTAGFTIQGRLGVAPRRAFHYSQKIFVKKPYAP